MILNSKYFLFRVGYHSRPQSQNTSNHQVPQTMIHPHMRHSSSNQNPQEVANNILQMAASTYMPNQTVTVPLSKNRSAPYHIPPKSPHNNYAMQGNCSTSTSQQQHMGQAHQFAYPNSSPHQSSQGPCASPMSPNSAYLHSPTASHHSGQSIPNSSPQSVHSPTYGVSGPCAKSPRSVAPSPGGDVCSPCQMASPLSCQVNAPNASPHHQQLRVNVPSVNLSMYQGQMTSPNHQTTLNQYSPKTNAVTPPASNNISPYSNSSRSSLHSPQHNSSVPKSNISGQFFSDSASDIPESNPPSSLDKSNVNPLQSLQKLCMLPDHQVIDPKSVVSDACLESTSSYEQPKNLNSDADNHLGNQDQVSASKVNSPEHCDKISSDNGNEMAENFDDICSDMITSTDNSSQKSCLIIESENCQESSESSQIQSSEGCLSSEKVENVEEMEKTPSTVDHQSEQEAKTQVELQQCNESQEQTGKEQTNEAQVDQIPESDEMKQDGENQGQIVKQLEEKNKENLLSSDAEEVTIEVKEVSENGVHAYPNCGLVQCKAMISAEPDGCEQVICKSIGCKENDDILSEIIDYENVTKENNNEIIPQLNGDENSCIQYYRPKCIKKTKKGKKVNPSFNLNSKLSNVRENPFLVKTYSRRDQIAAKCQLRRSQMIRSRSLRGVPARLASAAQYSSVNYSDSDSDDGGVLLVREDIDFNRDQGSPFPVDCVSDDMSQDGDSAIDTEREEAILEEDLPSQQSSPAVGMEEQHFQSDESSDINNVLALDTTKNSQTLAVDGAKNQAKVQSKSHCSTKKEDKSNLGKSVRRNSRNGHIQSEQKNGKLDKSSKSSKSRKPQNNSLSRNVNKDKDEDEESSTEKESAASKTPTRPPSKRPSRKRRGASSLKYGDLYYSADYVLDSEEEIEVEKKSKSDRKESCGSKDSVKDEEAAVIVLNDDDEEDDDDNDDEDNDESDVGKEEILSSADKDSKLDSTVSCVEVSQRTRCKASYKSSLKNISVEEWTGMNIKKVSLVKKKQKEQSIPQLLEKVKEVISISDEDLETDVTETPEKSLTKSKKKKKAQNVKRASKSGKGKLKKLQKSHAKFDLMDEETEEINLRKTISIMKKKHNKKPERAKQDESKSRLTGPFLRVRNTEPTCCRVVNQYEEEPEVSDRKISKKVSTPITVSTVHMSKLSAEKSIHVPSSSLTEETNWVCELCHKHSSFKFLGDLFGPYYCEGNVYSSNCQEAPVNSDFKRNQQKTVSHSETRDSSQPKAKKLTKSAGVSQPPKELWVHEDCIAWADGVLLIGRKIYGLEEATAIASATVRYMSRINIILFYYLR